MLEEGQGGGNYVSLYLHWYFVKTLKLHYQLLLVLKLTLSKLSISPADETANVLGMNKCALTKKKKKKKCQQHKIIESKR